MTDIDMLWPSSQNKKIVGQEVTKVTKREKRCGTKLLDKC